MQKYSAILGQNKHEAMILDLTNNEVQKQGDNIVS